jgi:hypothetical protein
MIMANACPIIFMGPMDGPRRSIHRYSVRQHKMQPLGPGQPTRPTNIQRTLRHQWILPWMLRNSPCTRRSMEFANNDKISGHNLARRSQERKCRPIQLHHPTTHMYRRLPQSPEPFLNVEPRVSQPAVVKPKNPGKHITTQNKQAHMDTTYRRL